MHRYRIAFLTGLAAGFVLGARAGRERYEQIKKLARRTADSPAVQQAAGALQAQAADLLKSATQKVTHQVNGRVPWLAESARQKVTGHIPGRRGTTSARGPAADNTPEATGQRPFAPTGDPNNGRSPS
jgi:uncharacterized membrane protein